MSSSGYIQSNGIGNTYVAVTAIPPLNTQTINMTLQESGKVTFIDSNPDPTNVLTMNINLGDPNYSAGAHYKFIYKGLIASRLTANPINIVSRSIAGGALTVFRVLVNGNATGAAGSSGANITLFTSLTINNITTPSATGIQIGDSLDCYCDGITWYIYANVFQNAALTINA